MPRRDVRAFIPIVVHLGTEQYEVHADGSVYWRQRPKQRVRKVHETSQPFRTEGATLRRVRDPELAARALQEAAGAEWTGAVRIEG